jgi:hypothetical protein
MKSSRDDFWGKKNASNGGGNSGIGGSMTGVRPRKFAESFDIARAMLNNKEFSPTSKLTAVAGAHLDYEPSDIEEELRDSSCDSSDNKENHDFENPGIGVATALILPNENYIHTERQNTNEPR